MKPRAHSHFPVIADVCPEQQSLVSCIAAPAGRQQTCVSVEQTAAGSQQMIPASPQVVWSEAHTPDDPESTEMQAVEDDVHSSPCGQPSEAQGMLHAAFVQPEPVGQTPPQAPQLLGLVLVFVQPVLQRASPEGQFVPVVPEVVPPEPTAVPDVPEVVPAEPDADPDVVPELLVAVPFG